MISVFPMLTLLAFSSNTNNNGYNYKSNFELDLPITVFKDVNSNNEQLEISGRVWCEGTFYCNNTENYMFSFTDVGFSVYYYVDSVSQNYSSSNAVTYSFDLLDHNNFAFGFYFDTTNVVNGDRLMGLTYNNFTQHCSDSINGNYYSDYLYDLGHFENIILDSHYFIDFQNNSSWIDNFERQVQTGLRATIDSQSIGYDIGYGEGYNTGYNDGYTSGNDVGYNNGYNNGYSVGFLEGIEADNTALTIFSGILAIGTLPINIFLAFFNFEVLGINFSELVSSMLSVCVCLIIIKKVFATDSGE